MRESEMESKSKNTWARIRPKVMPREREEWRARGRERVCLRRARDNFFQLCRAGNVSSADLDIVLGKRICSRERIRKSIRGRKMECSVFVKRKGGRQT